MSFTSTYGTNVGIGVVNNSSGVLYRVSQVSTSSSGQYVAVIKSTGANSATETNPDIFVSNDFGRNFIDRTPSPNNFRWGIIEYSGNGKYLYASGNFTNIYRSTDYGITFDPSISNQGFDRATDIAVSYTGQYVYFAAWNDATSKTMKMNRSINFGVRFDLIEWSGYPSQNAKNPLNDLDVSSNGRIYNVACSGNGKNVVIGVLDGFTYRNQENTGNIRKTTGSWIFYSSNYVYSDSYFNKSVLYDAFGYIIDNFSDITTTNPQTRQICMSSNGKYVSFIVETPGNYIFISNDFGQTFYQKTTNLPKYLQGLTMSYTGQYITCVNNNNLYISNDFGKNWSNTTLTSRTQSSNSNPASSASGQFLALTGVDLSPNVFTYIINKYNYSYTPIRISYENTFNFTFTSTTGGFLDCSGTYYLKNKDLQVISTTVVYADTDTSLNSITFTDISTNTFDYGMSNVVIHKKDEYGSDIDIVVSDLMVINATCFLEGTKILAMDAKFKPKYIPIEKLKPGMFVKTLHAGFIPIKYIGYSTIYNPGLTTCVRDQLFKCTKSAYPELTEDLVLTGNHSILVDTITDEEREQITETLGGIYVTERKYRLPAFNDKRAVPYEYQGDFRIWNLALENENYYENYGIYANGLLVETTSCRYLKEISGMTLVE